MTAPEAVAHPAKFSAAVLDAAERVLDARNLDGWILDPFAGTGKVHELNAVRTNTRDWRRTVGVELEPEWAAMSPYTQVGDATKLEFDDASFDAVVTSPPYGNRMADSYAGDEKGSRRHTYRIALGRPLTNGSAAGMQWGLEYQETMRRALSEMHRVLRRGGLLLLNLSDHVRKGDVVPVCDWFLRECAALEFVLEDEVPVSTPRNRHGANAELRADSEWLFVLRKP